MRYSYLKVLIVVFLLIPLRSVSQNLSDLNVVGLGKIAPGKTVDKRVKDAYGSECAGLLIESNLSGFHYGAYEGIVKIDHNQGEDLLYLSPDETVVTVYKSGFKPLKITLENYGINLKKGKVWQLVIKGKESITFIPINIITNPADAHVFLDNELIDSTDDAQVTHQVTPGEHTIMITRQGYETIKQTVDVNAKRTFFPFSLKSKKLIPIEIRSEPTNATIFLNDINKGTTDQGFFLYPGTYKATLSKAGYIDTTAHITVSDTSKNLFVFQLNPNVGYLHLDITPKDADVVINENNYSEQPHIALTPGTYRIDISKLGYFPQSGTATIDFNKTTTQSYVLHKQTGSLQFSILPLDAKVELIKNGDVVKNWRGLKILDSLQVGTYTLRATDSGYSAVTDSVLIQEGKTSVKHLVMKSNLSKEDTGTLMYNVEPADASVELMRGDVIINSWKGSKGIDGIPWGNYLVIAKKAGYVTSKEYVLIQPGRQTSTNVILKIPNIRNPKQFESISLGLGNSYGNLGLAFELRFGHFGFHVGAGTHTYVRSSDIKNHILVAGGVKYILLTSYGKKSGLELFVDAQYGSLADPVKAYGPSLLLGATFWIGNHIGLTTSWGGSYNLGEVINSPRLIIGADLLGLNVKF